MDRLSTYATKDNESTLEPEARKQNEEEAVVRLLEKLELDKEQKKKQAEAEAEATAANKAQENGTEAPSKTDESTESPKEEGDSQEQAANGDDAKPAIPAEVKLYDIFYDQVVNLIKTRALPIQDTMALLVSLVNLALNIYPDELHYVDQVLDFATEKTGEYTDHADLHSAPTQQHILHLLSAPLRSYVSIFTALALPHYLPLLTSQSYPTRRAVAGEIVRSLLKNRTLITTTENLDRVLQVARVLIKEGLQQSAGYPGAPSQRRGGETDETIEEQGWLARLVHLIQAPDNDTQLKVGFVICLQYQSPMLISLISFSNQLGKYMPMATSASDTPRQLLLRPQFAWPVN
jgi:vacuolar protein sorting-associated protein 35